MKYPPRRSDFVLWRGKYWNCIDHVIFGGKPIKDAVGAPIPCDRGVQGYLYPSDHLAVLTGFARVQQYG